MNKHSYEKTKSSRKEKQMKKTEEQAERCEYIHVHEHVVEEVHKQMPPEEELYDLADFFRVFSDSTRIKILYLLLCSEMCVCDIARLLSMEQSAISHQLRTLKQMKLVNNRRVGKSVMYSLADGHISLILSQGMEHIREE